jgi:hypothetical protein
MKDLCEYYGYTYYEEPEDPFLDDLIYHFDFYAKNGKYHMTYKDIRFGLGMSKSRSYLYKKIPLYVQSDEILQFGSKNLAEFVLPKYEQQYLEQKQKLDIEKLKPIAGYPTIINLTTYMTSIQIRPVSPSLRHRNGSKNPLVITRKRIRNDDSSQCHYYKFLYYNSGRIIIHIDFKETSVVANLHNFKVLFRNLREMLLSHYRSDLPPSFIISQFNGYRKPFEERPKQLINISKSFNLLDLLDYLSSA